MKFGLRKGWVILLCVLPFCVSCGDADLLDTNKWSDEIHDWTPSVKGAIAWGTFTVWDFLQDSTRDFRVEKEFRNEDSILVVKYTQPNIKSIDIAEVFELKGDPLRFEQNLLPKTLEIALKQNGSISIDDFYNKQNLECRVDTSVSCSLPLPDEFNKTELRKITLSKGTCICRLPKFDNLKYKVKVTYKSGGELVPLLDTNELAGGKDLDLPLENLTFDIGVPKNSIELHVEACLKEGIIDGNFNLQIEFSNYDFFEVEGKIVKTGGIEFGDSFDVDMDMLNDINGRVMFTDPKVELVMKNKGLGIPFKVDMTFSGTNTDSTLILYEPLQFNGNISDTTWVVNKDNSNIVGFLESIPRGELNYSGTVSINPEGKFDCVIYKDGSLGMDLNVEVPVEFDTSSHLSYSKSLTNLSLDQQYTDKIKEGTISLRVEENALPLDLSIPKMILLDENNRHLDTIAVISDNGEGKIKAGEKGGVLSFKIDKDTAKKLGQMKGILLEAAVSGGTGEPLKANARLKFTLMLEAKAAISDFNDFK